MDFTKELVGQNQWGIVSIDGSDFDLGFANNHGPKSHIPFVIRSDGGSGDRMRLTSFRPGPPPPLTLKADFSEQQGGGMDNTVNALAEDSQGRLVVGGFVYPNNPDRSGMARFLPNGRIDNDLRILDGFSGGVYTQIEDLLVLPDDSIVAVGEFETYQGIPRGGIVRILQDGDLSTTFASGSGANGRIRCISPLADGTFLIGGNFTEYDEMNHARLARIDASGALDTTFVAGAFGDTGDYVKGISVLEDGGALIWGRFSLYGGHATHHLARIFADGGVDTTFSAPDLSAAEIEEIVVLESGEIIVGARSTGRILYRLEEDGELDADFNPTIEGSGVHSMLIRKDGSMILGGKFTDKTGKGVADPMVLLADGTVVENGFQPAVAPDSRIETFLQASDGSVFAGGSFNLINENPYGRLAKFEAFNPDTYFLSETGTMTEGDYVDFEVAVRDDLENPQTFRVTVESDDPSILPLIDVPPFLHLHPGPSSERIYVYFQNDTAINGPRSFRIRLTPESPGSSVGTPDVMTITVLDDDVPGTVFLESPYGVMHEGRGPVSVKVKRFLNDPGVLSVKLRTLDGSALAGRDYVALDTTVNFPKGVYEKTVIINGPPSTPDVDPLRQFSIELYDPKPGTLLGTPQTATIDVNDKDDPGSVVVDYTIPDPLLFFRCDDMATAPDGTLFALMTYRNNSVQLFESRLIRFNSSGEGQSIKIPDGGPRRANSLSIESGYDGKIYVAGVGSVLRFFTDGTIDNTWTNPIAYDSSLPTTIQSTLPLPDGKILICGRITDPIGGVTRFHIARLMPYGSLDPTFEMGTTATGQSIREMAVDTSGKILVAGAFTSIQGVSRTNVVRILPDGELDETFDASAAVSSQGLASGVSRIAVAPDGKIFLGGNGWIIRVNSDGSRDTGFARVEGGEFALQPDGKLLVGVQTERGFTNARYRAIRVNSSGATDDGFSLYFPPTEPIAKVAAIELSPDGRIHFAGSFTSFDGLPAPGIATVRGDSGSVGGSLVWETNHISLGEGIGSHVVKLLRTGSSIGRVGVHFTLVSETAGTGTDVQALSGYHEFLPGEVEHEIGINVTNDTVPEGVESFRLVLHDTSGGARTGLPGTLDVDIIDDDGTGFGSWLSRFYPANPLDSSLPEGDPDGDGVKTFVEWMTDSNPTLNGDAKLPGPSWHEVTEVDGTANHLGISFYHNPSKIGFRTIVERSEAMEAEMWEILWDSDADPLRESVLITEAPPEGAGWMSVRSQLPVEEQEFLRIRYEMAPSATVPE